MADDIRVVRQTAFTKMGEFVSSVKKIEKKELGNERIERILELKNGGLYIRGKFGTKYSSENYIEDFMSEQDFKDSNELKEFEKSKNLLKRLESEELERLNSLLPRSDIFRLLDISAYKILEDIKIIESEKLFLVLYKAFGKILIFSKTDTREEEYFEIYNYDIKKSFLIKSKKKILSFLNVQKIYSFQVQDCVRNLLINTGTGFERMDKEYQLEALSAYLGFIYENNLHLRDPKELQRLKGLGFTSMGYSAILEEIPFVRTIYTNDSDFEQHRNLYKGLGFVSERNPDEIAIIKHKSYNNKTYEQKNEELKKAFSDFIDQNIERGDEIVGGMKIKLVLSTEDMQLKVLIEKGKELSDLYIIKKQFYDRDNQIQKKSDKLEDLEAEFKKLDTRRRLLEYCLKAFENYFEVGKFFSVKVYLDNESKSIESRENDLLRLYENIRKDMGCDNVKQRKEVGRRFSDSDISIVQQKILS